MIRQLSQSGNFAAIEFCEHLDAIRDDIEQIRCGTSIQPQARPFTVTSDEVQLPYSAYTMTAGMALAEPSMQEFLAESDLAISGIDNATFDPLQTPYWPWIWGGEGFSAA